MVNDSPEAYASELVGTVRAVTSRSSALMVGTMPREARKLLLHGWRFCPYLVVGWWWWWRRMSFAIHTAHVFLPSLFFFLLSVLPTHTNIHTDTDTQTQTQTHTNIHRHTHTHTHTGPLCHSPRHVPALAALCARSAERLAEGRVCVEAVVEVQAARAEGQPTTALEDGQGQRREDGRGGRKQEETKEGREGRRQGGRSSRRREAEEREWE